jgi:tetratricopeptide (TPR) repeat protein
MKLIQRIGLLLILVAVVLVADRLLGSPFAWGGLGGGDQGPIVSTIDPSLPAQPYNDSAVRRLEQRVAREPTNWQAFQQLGLGYIQKARDTADPAYYARAEEALRKALQINPQDAESLVGMGSLALSRHEFQQALDWGFKAHATNPHNPRVYGVIGDAYAELGNYEGAVEAVQQMVDTRPDLSSYSRVSYLRELYGKVPEAIDAMEQAVAAGSPNAENTNWCRVQLGQLYWQEGDFAAAEREYRHVLTYYPQFMYALAAMGQLRAAEGKLDEAAAYYQQAINVVPLPQYVSALGDIYLKQGRPDEARKQYDLFHFIARTNEVNGVNFDIERAAFLADHAQDPPLALELAQRAGAARRDIHTQDTLAWALYQNGRYDAAWTAMTEALRLGTRDPLLHFHAGMIAARRGDAAAARTHLARALDLNPQFHVFHADTARAELARLGQ